MLAYIISFKTFDAGQKNARMNGKSIVITGISNGMGGAVREFFVRCEVMIGSPRLILYEYFST